MATWITPLAITRLSLMNAALTSPPSPLSIVLLITHGSAPWMVALRRFIEVSIGIAIALLITVVWKVPQEG